MVDYHAITQARERYGLELTIADLHEITRTHATVGIKVADQSDGSSIWLIPVKGTFCRVILSPTNKSVITFLPLYAKISRKRSVGNYRERY